MYGFKSMLIHLSAKQNILKIFDKNSSSLIFLAKIISSRHICAKFCYSTSGLRLGLHVPSFVQNKAFLNFETKLGEKGTGG